MSLFKELLHPFKVWIWVILLCISHSSFAQTYKKEVFQSPSGWELPYRILFPENYDTTKTYPMVFFLHGAGERGNNNKAQLVHGSFLFKKKEIRSQFPAIVVFPQCQLLGYWGTLETNNGRWSMPLYDEPNNNLKAAMELMDELTRTQAVDEDRIYLMGLSMGGFGTMEWIARQPDRFAAAIPICGGGNLALTKNYGGKVPLWIFHGAKDEVVPVDLSRSLHEKLLSEGAAVRYTEYPEAKHNSWDSAFAEPDFLPWLFSHKRGDGTGMEKVPVSSATYTYTRIEKDSLQLDFYQPASEKERPSTIVYVHGGGFAGGKRDEPLHIAFAEDLARRGFRVANISYRLTMRGRSFSCDQAAENKIQTFLAAANDIREATRFLIDQAEALDLDTSKIILAGSSAGAEAILHAAYWTEETAPGELVSLPSGFKYAGILSFAGAMLDTTWIQPDNAIPSMFFHGTCDRLVPYGGAPHHYCSPDDVGYMPLFGGFAIADRMDKLGVSRYLLTSCGGGHEWAGWPLEKGYAGEMETFIEEAIEQGRYFQLHKTVLQDEDCVDKLHPKGVCR